jgi:ATP-dependent Clp protease adaptor protein ClpS
LNEEIAGCCNFNIGEKLHFMKDINKFKEDQEYEEVIDGGLGLENFLTLHNDEIHTFEYVIESLIEVCKHDMVQAEQCTFLIHYKGKCEVKKGSYKSLVPYKKELSRRGLTVTIE